MIRPRHCARQFAALAFLGVMLLGSACHLWHHLVDPDCGIGGGRGAEPCATCSALHSAVIASEPETGLQPVPVLLAEVPFAQAEHTTAPFVPGGAPRAPPAA